MVFPLGACSGLEGWGTAARPLTPSESPPSPLPLFQLSGLRRCVLLFTKATYYSETSRSRSSHTVWSMAFLCLSFFPMLLVITILRITVVYSFIVMPSLTTLTPPRLDVHKRNQKKWKVQHLWLLLEKGMKSERVQTRPKSPVAKKKDTKKSKSSATMLYVRPRGSHHFSRFYLYNTNNLADHLESHARLSRPPLSSWCFQK